MRLRPGDRLLTARGGVLPAGIRWWLSSEWSHVVPVLEADGTVLDVRLPRARIVRIEEIVFSRALLLRPAHPLDRIESWQQVGYLLEGWRYDLRSYLGFLVNKHLEDRQRINCAEGCLLMDHAGGFLSGRSLALVSPQSYAEFAAAGLFTVQEIR